MTSHTRHVAVLILAALSLIFVVSVAAAAAALPATQTPVFDASYVVAVNAGGNSYTDGRGILFQADKPYAPGSWGFAGGLPFTTTETIDDTDDQALYQSERYNMDAYRFDLPNGDYDVELYFAEIYPYTCPGKRIFDVKLENVTVINDLDIMFTTGPMTPLVRSFTTTVSDGRLDIDFPNTFPPAKVNAILIRQHIAGTPTFTATATNTRTSTATRTPTPTGTRPPGGYPTSTPPAVFEVRVNAGGPAFVDSKGMSWAGDKPFSAGSWGFVGGLSSSTTHDISGTDDPQLYQDSRSGMSEYRFTAPNGSYRVELKFAEIYSQSCPTSRIFDVSINAGTVITALDLANIPGRYVAGDFTFTTAVTTGQLTVAFSATVDAPAINAIHIETLARGPSPTPSATPTTTSTPTRTATATPTFSPLDILVNAGGPLYVDPDGNTWLADKAYTVGSWGYNGGSAYSVSQPIANTNQTPLYQSERFWSGAGSYAFDVPSGSYRVQLKLAELYFGYAGARRFNVDIEGARVLTNYDVFAAAGGRWSAIDREFTAVVADGQLNIDFTGVANNPKVNAVRVTRLGPPTATATRTTTPTQTPPLPTGTTTRTATGVASASATASPSTTRTGSPTATASASPTPNATAIPVYAQAVNAGDGVYTDTLGIVWSADRLYAAGAWGAIGGQVYTVGNAIAGTMDDALYQSERFGMSEYRFDVPNGTYNVDLRFAEIYNSTPGSRIFDVLIEGNPALYHLDIFAASGGRFRAYDRTFVAGVSDGQLNIAFVPVVGSPKVSALRVTSIAVATPTPSLTATPTSTPVFSPTPTRTATATRTPVPSTLTLPAVADTMLYVVFPNTNYGAASSNYCGGYGYQEDDNGQPCLYQFDLSALPANAAVTSAHLRLYSTQQNGTGVLTYTVHALLRPWAEMAATWNTPDGATPWDEEGAEEIGEDREGAASAVVSAWGAPPHWTEIDLTALVQRWANGSLANHGLKLQKTGGQATNVLLNMRESLTNAPELVVAWIPGGTATPTRTPTNTATATPTRTATPTQTATPSPTPIYDRRVNTGDGSYVDSQGYLWTADQAYTAGSWGYVSGLTYSNAAAIANTADPILYQTERYWPSGGSYKFDVANGTYQVTLGFAELYYKTPGYRSFNVRIEGAAALTSFDVAAAAGGALTAVNRSFLIDVTDGQINIDFIVGTGSPTVDAIRVTRQ